MSAQKPVPSQAVGPSLEKGFLISFHTPFPIPYPYKARSPSAGPWSGGQRADQGSTYSMPHPPWAAQRPEKEQSQVSFEAGAGKVRRQVWKSNPSTSLALGRLYRHR